MIKGYQCYQQGPQPGCLAPAVVSGFPGRWGGLFGSRIGSLGALLFGNLFDLQYGDNRFSVELAAAYC